jgi:hypothetical protein
MLLAVRTTERRLDVGGVLGELQDIDVLADDTPVALIRTGTGDQRLVFGEDAPIEPPDQLRFPLVRAAGPDRVLLADARVDRTWLGKEKPNGFLVDRSGSLEGVFVFGDGIADVLVSEEEVVATYFDEGVVSGVGTDSPAAEGVAVFDFEGELRFGYNSSALNPETRILDCYCAGWGRGRRLFFYPYPDLRLVTIDLEAGAHELWETPSPRGFNALTVGEPEEGREVVFLHAPYAAGGRGSGIYRWRIGDDRYDLVGDQSGSLRGLRSGRFLAYDWEGGYTVIRPGEAA